MRGHRAERLAEMIHSELAQRLRLDIKDPELGDVSITHVEVSKDLGRATVHWLPLGGGEPTRGNVEALERAAKQLRGPIGRALRLRTAPELVFVVDHHTDAAVKMTALLDEIGRDLRPGEGEE